MKILRVKLKNFRSHKHTVITLERVNFLRGLNRSGKSGIAMAVEMTLAGRCSVTDEGGKGFEQLIQEGQQTATVILECGTMTITLTLDRSAGRAIKIETDGRTILGRQAQEWIAEHIGTPDVINATMNAWRFMELNDNEQAALLARVLLPAKLELEPEVNAWLEHSKLAVVVRPSLFGTIEATHKAITAARTEVNRKIRDLKAIVEPEPINGNRATVQGKLDYLQSEQIALNEKVRIRSAAETLATRKTEQRAGIEREIETITANLRGLRAALLSDEKRKELEDAKGVCPACNRPLAPDVRLVIDDANRQTCEQAVASLDRLKAQLHDTKAKSEPLLDVEETTETLQSSLAELRSRIAKGMDALIAIGTREAEHATYQRQLRERQSAEAQVVELEKLLEYFGPRGIKAKLIGERLDLFTDRVNAVLDHWGYSLRFAIEPYSLRITETDVETGSVGPALTPNQLSASERYRLGVAFAMAIADWTGLRLLIADGADILDKDDKWKLAQAFLQSDIEQAIMTSTGIAGTFEAAGTAFYTLSKVDGITATEIDAITAMGEM